LNQNQVRIDEIKAKIAELERELEALTYRCLDRAVTSGDLTVTATPTSVGIFVAFEAGRDRQAALIPVASNALEIHASLNTSGWR
jgi:hypothetical protein